MNLETMFAKSGIPYRMLGALRFYDRKEVKDIIAYLHVINNPSDNIHLNRIVNEPKRGIGDTSYNTASQIGEELGLPTIKILEKAHDYNAIPMRAANSMTAFAKIIIDLIEEFVAQHPERSVVFPSLGARRYLSVLRCVAAVVGNSSSGILEVPSMHIPTLNIGIRQKGRQRATSVIDCGVSLEEISAGLSQVLSQEERNRARNIQNPYEQPDTLNKIVEIVATFPLDNIIQKPFYDIK
jgi:hypothetical protein